MVDKITTSKDNGIYKIENGDNLNDYDELFVTSENIYGVNGSQDSDFVENEKNDIVKYVHSLADDGLVSATGRRTSSRQLQEKLRAADNPYRVSDEGLVHELGYSVEIDSEKLEENEVTPGEGFIERALEAGEFR